MVPGAQGVYRGNVCYLIVRGEEEQRAERADSSRDETSRGDNEAECEGKDAIW